MYEAQTKNGARGKNYKINKSGLDELQLWCIKRASQPN